mmetsp:Transcript_2805/g.4825  ORF Transcript_2805/g.4825 Transcript_2805/m.4825 type:complete len:255 (-) Transcript_2805:1-765(-)
MGNCASAEAGVQDSHKAPKGADAVKPEQNMPAAGTAPETKPVPPAAAADPAAKKVKVAVIYYSMYGHIRTMAEAYKTGLEGVEGVEVTLLQVAETLPAEVLAKMHAPPKSADPLASAEKLTDFDAFVFGFPTRFGTVAAQFKAFIDTTGGLWSSGGLAGKPYSLFTSTATQNGGQETTFISAVNNFTHHGMIFVPAGTVCPEVQFDLDEVHGGSPWGPACLAGPTGARQPSEKELKLTTAAGANSAKWFKKIAA